MLTFAAAVVRTKQTGWSDYGHMEERCKGLWPTINYYGNYQAKGNCISFPLTEISSWQLGLGGPRAKMPVSPQLAAGGEICDASDPALALLIFTEHLHSATLRSVHTPAHCIAYTLRTLPPSHPIRSFSTCTGGSTTSQLLSLGSGLLSPRNSSHPPHRQYLPLDTHR
jgi:hypothetical protein